MATDYNKQAQDFADKYDVTLKVLDRRLGEKWADGVTRHIYRLQLSRFKDGKRLSYDFEYGQSIEGTYQGIRPSMYDVLTCLTKTDPGDIDDFRMEYGYQDKTIRETVKMYIAVKEEYENMVRLFGDVMGELCKIY